MNYWSSSDQDRIDYNDGRNTRMSGVKLDESKSAAWQCGWWDEDDLVREVAA